jgi:membrane fusion protein, multidrug efflux system
MDRLAIKTILPEISTRKDKPVRKIAGFFVGLALAAAVAAGSARAMPQMPAMPVNVAPVIERDVRQSHDYSGRLAAVDRADIHPRISGVIESVNFKDGATVQKGDLLFVIDPRPYQAEVDRTAGALASAQAQYTLARTELARGNSLIKDKSISKHEYDQRKNAFDVAEANIKSAKAALDAARLNLDYTAIKAPIAGKAGRAEVTAGNLVQAGTGGPVLTTIIANNPIYADFEMDEATYMDYARATPREIGSAPVKMGLTGEKDTPHAGHIESFDNQLNAASGTIRVRAVFDNPDGALVPGLFARIRIGSPGEGNAVLITDAAVGTDQDKKFVYVVGGDNKLSYREVKLGASVDNLRIVNEGLKAGEKIVVSGIRMGLRPGMEVAPQVVSMEAADAANMQPAGQSPAQSGGKKP